MKPTRIAIITDEHGGAVRTDFLSVDTFRPMHATSGAADVLIVEHLGSDSMLAQQRELLTDWLHGEVMVRLTPGATVHITDTRPVVAEILTPVIEKWGAWQ